MYVISILQQSSIIYLPVGLIFPSVYADMPFLTYFPFFQCSFSAYIVSCNVFLSLLIFPVTVLSSFLPFTFLLCLFLRWNSSEWLFSTIVTPALFLFLFTFLLYLFPFFLSQYCYLSGYMPTIYLLSFIIFPYAVSGLNPKKLLWCYSSESCMLILCVSFTGQQGAQGKIVAFWEGQGISSVLCSPTQTGRYIIKQNGMDIFKSSQVFLPLGCNPF